MEKIKQINIKKLNIFFVTIDKKLYKEIDIFNISCITIEKFGDCKNINSVKPLSLIIHPATGYFKEKNDEKYLIYN